MKSKAGFDPDLATPTIKIKRMKNACSVKAEKLYNFV